MRVSMFLCLCGHQEFLRTMYSRCRVNLFCLRDWFYLREESIFSVVVCRIQSNKRKLVKRGRRLVLKQECVCLWKAKTCFLNLLQNRFLCRLKLNHPWRATTMFLGHNSSKRSCLGLAGFYWWKCLISAVFRRRDSKLGSSLAGRRRSERQTVQYPASSFIKQAGDQQSQLMWLANHCTETQDTHAVAV